MTKPCRLLSCITGDLVSIHISYLIRVLAAESAEVAEKEIDERLAVYPQKRKERGESRPQELTGIRRRNGRRNRTVIFSFLLSMLSRSSIPAPRENYLCDLCG